MYAHFSAEVRMGQGTQYKNILSKKESKITYIYMTKIHQTSLKQQNFNKFYFRRKHLEITTFKMHTLLIYECTFQNCQISLEILKQKYCSQLSFNTYMNKHKYT